MKKGTSLAKRNALIILYSVLQWPWSIREFGKVAALEGGY